MEKDLQTTFIKTNFIYNYKGVLLLGSPKFYGYCHGKKIAFLLLILSSLLVGLPVKAQIDPPLVVNYTLAGYEANADNFKLNKNQTYQIEELNRNICASIKATWSVFPKTGVIISNTSALSPTIRFTSAGYYRLTLDVVTSTQPGFFCVGEHGSMTKNFFVGGPPVAQFTINGSTSNVTVGNNSTVNFTDASTNDPTSWDWKISPSSGWSYTNGKSSTNNPSIKFTVAGTYTVSLKAVNYLGNSSTSKTIVVMPSAPVAQFTMNGATSNLTVTSNSTVNFADISTNNPTAWEWSVLTSSGWNFSSGNSYTKTLGIKFSNPGNYTISLKASNVGGTGIVTKNVVVKSLELAPVAQFTMNGSTSNTTIEKNEVINFADASANNPSSWQWSISPSSGWNYSAGNSNSQNPSIHFNSAGTYAVSFRAGNKVGYNSISKTVTVTSSNPGVPVAQFTINGSTSKTTVSLDSIISLSDVSSNSPISWQWTISPSTGWNYVSSGSTSENPNIKFNIIGTYSVTLKAINNTGYGTISKNILVTNKIIGAPVPQFTIDGSTSNTTVNSGSIVTFMDVSTNDPSSWLWAVSPSTGWNYTYGKETTKIQSIKFNTPGTYSFLLKVSNSSGTSTINKKVVVNASAAGTPEASFDLLSIPALDSPVLFRTWSNDPSITEDWTVSPSTGWHYYGISTSKEPTIEFNKEGTYLVILKKTNLFGSTTASKIINIDRPKAVRPQAIFKVNGQYSRSNVVSGVPVHFTNVSTNSTIQGFGELRTKLQIQISHHNTGIQL